MLKKRLFVYAMAAAAFAGFPASDLKAQYAPAPETYSITQLSSLVGPTVIERIWRDGSKAAIALSTPSAQPGGKASRVQTVYDLAAHTTVTWDLATPKPQYEQNPASYQFGPDSAGHMLVTGGHLVEMTSQMQNGVLRIDNAGKAFHVEIRVPNGGGKATLYRQCAGPQTTLLFVVTSLENMTPGDWLWVKSGKQAGP